MAGRKHVRCGARDREGEGYALEWVVAGCVHLAEDASRSALDELAAPQRIAVVMHVGVHRKGSHVQLPLVVPHVTCEVTALVAGTILDAQNASAFSTGGARGGGTLEEGEVHRTGTQEDSWLVPLIAVHVAVARDAKP